MVDMRRKRKVNPVRVLIIIGICIALIPIILLLPKLFEPQTKSEPAPEPVEIKSFYDFNSFIKDENGIITYDNPEYNSIIGIDVSTFNHEIDWEAVAADDVVQFAMIRAGYRGAIEGLLHTDDQFYNNIEGAVQNGIPVGIYWYCSGITVDEINEEVDYLLSILEGYPITYPVVFDMEPYEADENGGRISTMSVEEKTEKALLFCQRIRDAGYTPMIYGNVDWLYSNLNFEELEGIDIWYAAYQSKPHMYDEFRMWQFSNAGRIDGIETAVDLNLYLEKVS